MQRVCAIRTIERLIVLAQLSLQFEDHLVVLRLNVVIEETIKVEAFVPRYIPWHSKFLNDLINDILDFCVNFVLISSINE